MMLNELRDHQVWSLFFISCLKFRTFHIFYGVIKNLEHRKRYYKTYNQDDEPEVGEIFYIPDFDSPLIAMEYSGCIGCAFYDATGCTRTYSAPVCAYRLDGKELIFKRYDTEY